MFALQKSICRRGVRASTLHDRNRHCLIGSDAPEPKEPPPAVLHRQSVAGDDLLCL